MVDQDILFPFYKKVTIYLLGMVLAGVVLYLGQNIVVPFFLAVLQAILLLPAVKYLERRRIPRMLALSIVVGFAIVIFVVLVYFMSVQVLHFTDDIPAIRKNLEDHFGHFQKWMRSTFRMTYGEQKELISNAAQKVKESTPVYLGATFYSISETFVLGLLLPIYTFLILYYRSMIRRFLIWIFPVRRRLEVEDILKESERIIQQYMAGLFLEMLVVAIFNVTGFLLIGLDYAILLGVMAAILNLIPYIGMMMATIIILLVSLSSSTDLSLTLWAVGILLLVQFVDNNILMPRLVGSKVKINALITILAVFTGGALMGLLGTLLAIPFVAILKIVFDRLKGWEPWGMILGDEMTGRHKLLWLARLEQGFRKKRVDSIR